MRLALLTTAAALLAGCSLPEDGERGSVLLHASFGPGYTQADVDEVCRILACEGMETSDPPRIAGWFLSHATCEHARERVLAVPHATAEACGTPLSTAWWTFQGSFLEGYTQDDITAVCRAATARDACTLTKSEPPGFGFSYPTLDVCGRVLAEVRAVPHVTAGACSEGGA